MTGDSPSTSPLRERLARASGPTTARSAADGGAAAELPPVPTIAQGARLWWDQADTAQLPIVAYRFQLFVDGAPSGSLNAQCAPVGARDFRCSATLPPLSTGVRQLAVGAVVSGEPVVKSQPLDVDIQGDSPPWTAPVPDPDDRDGGPNPAPDDRDGGPNPAPDERARDRDPDPDRDYDPDPYYGPNPDYDHDPDTALRVRAPAEPVGAVTLADGRTLIGDRSGRIFLAHPGAAAAAPALDIADVTTGQGLGLQALAAAGGTGSEAVFALYTTAGGLRLTRYELVADVLTAPAVVVDGLPMTPQSPHAALGVGPDGMVYVALGSAGGADGTRRAADLGDWAGKLLRFAPDGTTPRDHTTGSPVIMAGLRAPRGIAWTDSAGGPWVSDQPDDSGLTLHHAARTRGGWTDQATAVALPTATRAQGLVADAEGSLWSTVVSADGTPRAMLHLTPTRDGGLAPTFEPLEEPGSTVVLPGDDSTTYAWTSHGLLRWAHASR